VNDREKLTGTDLLFINGRWLMGKEELALTGDEQVGLCEEDVAYIRVKTSTLRAYEGQSCDELIETLKERLPNTQTQARMINYSWDLVNYNPDAIQEDFEAQNKQGIHCTLPRTTEVLGSESSIYVAPDAEIHPLVVLDAREGPIIIENGVTVFPNSRIEGPSAIGEGTQIVGTNVREGCAIGPICKIGGEVEESIIHGYTNKYHTGFIGHAYVGEWVNLGALTTNSDLKNDYSGVELHIGPYPQNRKKADSGSTKVGAFIGDHTKTGIGVLFNTGTVVGVMNNILPLGKLPPKFISSFLWFAPPEQKEVKQDKLYRLLGGHRIFSMLLETAGKAMARRKLTLTAAYEKLFRTLYEATEEERAAYMEKPWG
jgi:UDP-N-acetylglucosamine diphosphorylase/glucosamine-1-phosphate N-acetyltransferase